MASRTKSKEAARARRLAEEQERQERQRRQRRLRLIGTTVFAAIAIAAVAIVLSSSGGKKQTTETGLQTGAQLTATINAVNQLLQGIPQNGSTLGKPSAPVTMDYYGDLECPVCQDFTLNGGFPDLVKTDVRAGKVKVVYKAFQTATPDTTVFQTQQVAALAAGKQSKFWYYTELFYRQQGAEGTDYVNDAYLTGIAKQISGLNLNQWQTARQDQTLLAQVTTEGTEGTTAGVQGTPTLIFSGPKGQAALTNVPTYADIQKAIKQVS